MLLASSRQHPEKQKGREECARVFFVFLKLMAVLLVASLVTARWELAPRALTSTSTLHPALRRITDLVFLWGFWCCSLAGAWQWHGLLAWREFRFCSRRPKKRPRRPSPAPLKPRVWSYKHSSKKTFKYASSAPHRAGVLRQTSKKTRKAHGKAELPSGFCSFPCFIFVAFGGS